MTPTERICALLLDEISIKPFLTYNPHQDLVERFEDFRYFVRTNTASNSALVFMLSVNLAVHILSHSVAVATMVNFFALPPEAMQPLISQRNSTNFSTVLIAKPSIVIR
ncbi:hypothetical protein PoB_004055000 [Plakobranchus ocellatus]|uniref:Transposable element P transposase-like RNase H domain-containing protein n=1 Tax=Plakobranchus ocellatus TaxID=259542 RepID=A0AAV4B3A1_9GAST|nr:hypothetical protein PoB_004055000 [Plakobranchus ocellatus]